MRVLITGGAGFIGANLARLLLQSGHIVRVFDNFSSGRCEYIEGLDLEILKGDILDADTVNQAVYGMESVVHLAAQTGVPGSLKNPRLDCEINVFGTLNLLEASREQGIRRFIFASSNAPLGRQSPPATEDKAPLPISPYGASKLAGEGYCLAYHGSWGLGTVVLRFANLYGPFSTHKNSVTIKFFKDIYTDGKITIDGDGNQTRDLIYVDDLCCAIRLALESDKSGEVFQIATGVETSILELATIVKKVMAKEIDIQYGPPRQGDIRKNYSGIAKVERLLGFRPKVSLEEGLTSLRDWFIPWMEKHQ